MNVSKTDYVAFCRKRWHGEYLRDALNSWNDWEESDTHAMLVGAMREYHRNAWQEDLNGKCHNPEGTLSAFLWKLQSTVQPDKSCLAPFIDFNEDSQSCFLRRGLLYYCSLILRELEKPDPVPEGQKEIINPP